MADKKVSSRRKMLKSVAVGGGAIATAQALPSKWTSPVVNMVMTPAHAQTSVVVAPTIVPGVYSTASPLAIAPASSTSGPQFALLDMLISPANAQTVSRGHLIDDICASEDDATTPGMSNLHIRVNANMTVDIAVDSLNDGGDACGNFGGIVSVVSGTSIPDTQIQLDDDEFVRLTNMMIVADGQISGNYSADNDNDSECSGSFTVLIGGTYPSALDCRDD